MILRGLACDGGCGQTLHWEYKPGEVRLTQQGMEREARRRGWQAPDKAGRHLCFGCRRPEGRDQWRRRENVRRGLPVDYGRGTCRCGGDAPDCLSAGHPGVTPVVPEC